MTLHTLVFEIDYKKEHAGWIDCWLNIDGIRHHLEASCVFPPFMPLLRFVKTVAGERFPAQFTWDEEGILAEFEASAVPEDNALVHLRIKHDESELPWLDAPIERETVIQAFLLPIVDFANHFWKAQVEWYTPKKLVNQLQQAILNGIPLRSDIHAPQVVECSVESAYESGSSIEGYTWLQIGLEEEIVAQLHLFDTSPFWQDLLNFFGGIASGSLPTACEHLRITRVGLNPDQDDPMELRLLTRLIAEPLDTPENFRLKIITRWEDDADFLRLNEVLNRRTFVSSFAASFKHFLAKEYRVRPDPEGQTFDLRTLPLGNLP